MAIQLAQFLRKDQRAQITMLPWYIQNFGSAIGGLFTGLFAGVVASTLQYYNPCLRCSILSLRSEALGQLGVFASSPFSW
jgi:hypothetical protein